MEDFDQSNIVTLKYSDAVYIDLFFDYVAAYVRNAGDPPRVTAALHRMDSKRAHSAVQIKETVCDREESPRSAQRNKGATESSRLEAARNCGRISPSNAV
jgi:hypothetical protein